MMLKKLQSICLILAILVTSVAYSCKVSATSDDLILAEFNSVEVIESYMKAKTTIAPSTENTGLYDVTGRASITPGELKDLFNLSLGGLDASSFGYLNMWVYSPEETASYVRVSIYDTLGKFQAYSFEVNWEGWNVVAIPFDKPINVKPEFNLSTIGTIYVGTTGWEGTFGTWTKEHYLNFDKVWLSLELPEEAKEEDKSLDKYGNKTLAEFSSQAQIDKLKAVKPKMALESTTENVRLYDISAKATVSLENPQTLLSILNLDLDFSQYASLNFWIYSPEKTSSGLAVPIYDDKGEYSLYTIPVDFEGWKMVCLDIDEPIYTKDNFDITKVTSVNIDFNQWTGRISPWEKDGFINIDRVWLSPEPVLPFELIGSSYPENSDSVPTEDAEFVFEFSNPILNEVSDEKIFVCEKGNEVSSIVSATSEENRLYISFNRGLEKDTSYEIDFSFYDIHRSNVVSESYKFHTDDNAGVIGKPVFYNEDFREAENSFDGLMNVSSEVSDAEVCMVVAVYDSQNRNVALHTAKSDGEFNDEIQIKDIAMKSDNTAVAFVCAASGDMTLLRNDVAVLRPEDSGYNEMLFESEATGNMSAELTGANVEGNILTLDAKVGEDVRDVVVSLKNSDDELKQVFVLNTTGETEISQAFDLTGIHLDNGTYAVSVCGFGFSGKGEKNFYYISKENQEYICKTINDASSVEDVEDAFAGNELSLHISDGSLKNAYHTIYEQKPFGSFQDIAEVAKKSEALLTGLNNCNWTTLTDFLEENKDYVLGDAENAEYYFSLGERDQNKINDEIYKIKKSFSDFIDFREVFSKVAGKFRDGDYNEESKPSKGSGGGGGGGGKVSIAPSVPVAPLVNQNPETPESSSVLPFGDIGDALWAKPYIETLYANKILAHSDKFRPNDKITREEFLKLIIECFGIKIETAEAVFDDVASDAWYAKYIGAAHRLGIVNGESETIFGIGKPILRQDAAVMVYRTANLLGMKFESTLDVPFSDKDDISSYAAEAVGMMYGEQIINGTETGLFLPKNDMTRAEGAKIVCAVMSKRNGVGVE